MSNPEYSQKKANLVEVIDTMTATLISLRMIKNDLASVHQFLANHLR